LFYGANRKTGKTSGKKKFYPTKIEKEAVIVIQGKEYKDHFFD
jgi:hypothetical protein